MANTLTFYTNPMSRGQIARWMLEEVGEPYEQVIVAYGEAMRAPDYLRLNPMGKVPTITHGPHIVTEAAAICMYLADAFPQAELAPPLEGRANYYRWLLFAAGPLEQAIVNKSFGWEPDSPQAQGRLGFGSFDRTVGVLEQWLTGRSYICNDRFSAADVYVGAMVDWGLKFKTLPALPAFETYITPLRERAAYRRAKQIDAELSR